MTTVTVYIKMLDSTQIVTDFTRSCCQCIENFEFELIGIKFKFNLTINDSSLEFNISGSDSLNSIAVLNMKLIGK